MTGRIPHVRLAASGFANIIDTIGLTAGRSSKDIGGAVNLERRKVRESDCQKRFPGNFDPRK